MIIPAILEDSLIKLQERVHSVGKDAKKIHIDICDGDFVNTKTFVDLAKLNTLNSSTPIQIHLMVKNPIAFVSEIRNVECYIAHVEEITDSEIFMQGQRVGLAINYNTPLQALLPYLGLVEFVQFMSVTPGKQGNTHISDTSCKVEAFKEMYPHVRIQVDGGINSKNIQNYLNLGVEGIVIGAEIINTKEPAVALRKFMELEQKFKSQNA